MDQRHFSEEAFLHATLIEFVKCLGSGKRARMFVESIDCGAFESFFNFLGNPGMEHNLRWRRPWRRQDILSVIVITNMDMIQRQHNRATKRKGNKIKPSAATKNAFRVRGSKAGSQQRGRGSQLRPSS